MNPPKIQSIRTTMKIKCFPPISQISPQHIPLLNEKDLDLSKSSMIGISYENQIVNNSFSFSAAISSIALMFSSVNFCV